MLYNFLLIIVKQDYIIMYILMLQTPTLYFKTVNIV